MNGKDKKEIPRIQDALRWAILIRIVVISSILIPGIAILYEPGSEFLSHRLLFFFVMAIVFSVLEYLYSRRNRSVVFQVYTHLSFDLVVISSIVDATGSVGSQFTFLYILLILETGIFLKRIGAVMWATISSLVYLLLGIVRFWGEGPLLSDAGESSQFFLASSGHPLFDVFFPLSLFYLVALIIGFIVSKLDSAGSTVVNLGKELKRMSLESSDILFNIPTGVLTCDLTGRMVFVNPACRSLLRLERDELTGHPIDHVLDKRYEALKELINRTIENQEPVSRAEVILKGNRGEERVFLGVSTSLIHDLNGEILGVTAIFQNITNLKRLETMSTQTLRLKAIVEMSASMAHEIKNPLSSIQGSLELLGNPLTGEERMRVLERARKESKRLWGLLDDFLRLARIQVEEWNPIHLRELIEEVKALVMVRPDISSRIMIQLQGFGGDDQDIVWGDPELLKQVFLNLFINSAEAIDGIGKIRIYLEPPAAARSEQQEERERYLRFVVEDDGSGFTIEAAERAFEPFFTTKEGGSGLGLAITRKIIEAHYGRIEICPAEGRGARFVLSFPEQRPAVVRNEPRPPLIEKESR